MNFGKLEEPSQINFILPEDHPETKRILNHRNVKLENISVGLAKWGRANIVGFYPKGTKDELTYYASQFNSIELNATFYKIPSAEQIANWKEKTGSDFKFFPKITNTISHYRRLINTNDLVNVINGEYGDISK